MTRRRLRPLAPRFFLAVLAASLIPLLLPAPASAATFTLPPSGNTQKLGAATEHGDLANHPLNKPIVGMASTPGGNGYWLVGSDGGVFTFDAPFFGSTGGIRLNQPIVGMAAMPTNNGYRFVASDGGVFDYGDAQFYGSTGSIRLNKPVVGMANTPDGLGYWLVASDGGIFAYGDAHFWGSTGSIHLNQPIVGMAPTPDGGGYWLVASDGGVFTFGNAHFYGSTGGIRLNQPIVGMASTPGGNGYWLAAADGGMFAFNAPYYGSGGAHGRIAGMARTGNQLGYWFVSSAGAVVAANYPTVSYPSPGASLSNTPYYAFEYLGNGLPARWDPCSGPVHYTVSSYHMPTGGDKLVQNVFNELAGITGLQFQYDGLVSSPFNIDQDHNNGLEVGWLPPNEYTGPAGTDGYTQVGWVNADRGARMFSANVEILEASTQPWYVPSAGVDGNYINVVKHEIGHAMGLNHAQNSSQVMYQTSEPDITDYSGTGGGDLQGLADLGASLGCVR